MTPEEIVCEFMEPRPRTSSDIQHGGSSLKGWWEYRWSPLGQRFVTRPNSDKTDSLDALWDVEERLIDLGMSDVYRAALVRNDAYFWHATAEHKIKALAVAISGDQVP